MNPVRTNNRSARTRGRTGGPAFGSTAGSGRGSRFGSPAPSRSGGSSRSGGYGRRPAAVQGEFALPETITPALPAVEAFADLAMPAELLAALTVQGVTVPFPIQGAT
ncbi:ATP-dependent helicase, partial [Streptomyces virginiae]